MGLKDFLFKNQRHIENKFYEYMDAWKECTEAFKKGINIYLESGITEQFEYWTERTHKNESHADDLRRNLEFELYSKALLPESRGDILGLVEAIDKVINKVESVLFQILLERIELPQLMKPKLERIYNITFDCNELVYEASKSIFKNLEKIIPLSKEIDEKESECDHAERDALKTLYDSDLPWHVKLQLKNLIIESGNITDRAESVSDRLVIFSVKRRV